MRKAPPPLHYMRSFESAARHLSFTRAAAELGYTQAAISTHIRALETYVGRDLFVRNARSLELSEIGEAFLPTLRHALTQIDEATEAVVSSSRDRSIIVVCPMSLAVNWLTVTLNGFLCDNPGIDVVVHGNVWDMPDDSIADIVITTCRDDEAPAGAMPLWRESISVVCAPDLARRIAQPQDIGPLRKIVVSGRQEYWSMLGLALGVTFPLDRALRTNGTNVALEMASQGMGVTISQSSLSDLYIKRGLLVDPFGVTVPCPWAFYLATPPRAKGAAVQRLASYLRSAGP